MSFVFVQTSHDYADEFNVEACFVAAKPHFEADLDKIRALFEEGAYDSVEFYFGTNQFLSFESFDDFMEGVKVQECSEEFYDEFKRLSPSGVGYDIFDQLLNL